MGIVCNCKRRSSRAQPDPKEYRFEIDLPLVKAHAYTPYDEYHQKDWEYCLYTTSRCRCVTIKGYQAKLKGATKGLFWSNDLTDYLFALNGTGDQDNQFMYIYWNLLFSTPKHLSSSSKCFELGITLQLNGAIKISKHQRTLATCSVFTNYLFSKWTWLKPTNLQISTVQK